MAIYVRVNQPTGQGKDATFRSPFHDKAGEVVGFAVTAVDERVLVALEDGSFVTFAPSDLRRVGGNQGFLRRLE